MCVSLCACACVCACVCMYSCMCKPVCARLHLPTNQLLIKGAHMHKQTCKVYHILLRHRVHAYMCMHIYMYIYVYTYICIHIYIYMYIHTYVYIYMSISIFIYMDHRYTFMYKDHEQAKPHVYTRRQAMQNPKTANNTSHEHQEPIQRI